jgi:hypothetical protein
VKPRETTDLKAGEFSVNDLIYLGLGVGMLALMALYAVACDRL